jgi:hypothetical protein
MTKTVAKTSRQRKPAAPRKKAGWWTKAKRVAKKHSRDLPLIAFQSIATLCIEGIGAAYAIDHAPKEMLVPTLWGKVPLEGLLGAAVIVCFASLGSYLLYVSGAKSSDRRKRYQAEAPWAFVIGLALLAPCMDQFANGIAWPRQKVEYTTYRGSDAEEADRFTLSPAGQATSNPEKDSEARAALKKGIKPAVADPTWSERLGAIFMYAALGLAAFFGRSPAPITPAEERELKRADDRLYRDRKDNEKRKRADELARKLRRQGWPEIVPDFLVGLFSAPPQWQPPEAWRGAAGAMH